MIQQTYAGAGRWSFAGSFASLDWYQWYPMVSNGLTVEIDICLPLLASWSSRSDKVQLLLAQSLSESIGSMRIYASMLPCIHAGRWPNAAGCALKSWGPGSRNTLRANLEWGFWPKRTMMQGLTTRVLAGALWCRANRTRMFATVKYMDIQETTSQLWCHFGQIDGRKTTWSTWIINWANNVTHWIYNILGAQHCCRWPDRLIAKSFRVLSPGLNLSHCTHCISEFYVILGQLFDNQLGKRKL